MGPSSTTLRYSSRIRDLLNRSSMRRARMYSLIFREMDFSLDRKRFLANCWVIVLPPRPNRPLSAPAPHRDVGGGARVGERLDRREKDEGDSGPRSPQDDGPRKNQKDAPGDAREAHGEIIPPAGDRKSTRLNS